MQMQINTPYGVLRAEWVWPHCVVLPETLGEPEPVEVLPAPDPLAVLTLGGMPVTKERAQEILKEMRHEA